MASWIRSNINVELLNKSLSRMRAVDLQMLSLGMEMPPTKASWVTFFIYTLMIVAFFFKSLAMPSFFSRILLLLFYSPNFLIVSIEDCIDRINSLLQLRFDAIEQHLLQCIKMDGKNAVKVLETLILCHDRLSNASEEIEEYLWVQVTSVLAVFFLASFCDTYAVSLLYNDDSFPHKGLSANLFIFLCTFYFIRSKLNYNTWYCNLTSLYYTATAFCIMASWIRCNINVELLNKSLSRMRAVDLQMLSLGMEMPPTKASWVTLFLYTLLTIAFFIKAMLMPSFFIRILGLLFFSPYVLIISIEDCIDRINSLLRLRFDAIEQHLLQCFKMDGKNAVKVLETLILCHDHLSNASEEIEEYLWIQVTSVLAVFFLASFCDAYAVSLLYKDETFPYDGLELTEKAVWIVIIITVAWRVCHQFATISTKVNSSFTML
ncbi:unnamed protein product [Nezara viridula]|uniref:Uncharacterized protein n=1 Tax=Nezara viridula TaxID=85310 RepID=A0A9P0EGD6_NEZVI|nr:unnamed protein product [Nezara viridula]